MQTQILQNAEISRASRWLSIQLPEGALIDHEPGTVVGLSMQHGGGTLRHAYTVSRADASKRTLEFLYRVIPTGRMTPHLSALAPGAELTLSGRGGHPIVHEVETDPAGIVLVSTGTGIGPIYGYAQRALAAGLKTPLTLVAGFREAADICLQPELQALAAVHPQFKYHFSLSRPKADWGGLRGWVTESLPGLLGPVKGLHFHLVGNGAMILDLYRALRHLGLTDARVTSETYFNFDADEPSPERVQALASSFTL